MRHKLYYITTTMSDITIDLSKKYYKVTNEKECHYGFQYKDGLNVLIEPFLLTKQWGDLSGFYFTTIDHINQFYRYGIYLREVILPADDPELKVVKHGIFYRANKVILGKKYSLLDITTYHDLGLDAASDSRAIDYASEHGLIDVLNKWKSSGLELKYSNRAIDLASEKGCVEVLDWWKYSELELIYSNYAIDLASEYGHIEVLNWWKSSGLELKYSEHAIDCASAYGHIEVLNWWKSLELELKYSNKIC